MISRPVRHPLGVSLLLGVGFFVVPVSAGDSAPVIRGVLTFIVVAAAVVLIIREIRRQAVGTAASASSLVIALVVGVLVFALLDYAIAVHLPGQFTDLATRIDALYFGLTTVATVGYGDVHATGQFARGVLCVQLLFNLVVIGAGASVLARSIRERSPRGGS